MKMLFSRCRYSDDWWMRMFNTLGLLLQGTGLPTRCLKSILCQSPRTFFSLHKDILGQISFFFFFFSFLIILQFKYLCIAKSRNNNLQFNSFSSSWYLSNHFASFCTSSNIYMILTRVRNFFLPSFLWWLFLFSKFRMGWEEEGIKVRQFELNSDYVWLLFFLSCKREHQRKSQSAGRGAGN